jgi:hypothetical protein
MKLEVMGVQFDNVTMQEALDRAKALMAGERAAYVVTPNAEIVYEAMHSEEMCALLNDADLVLPDGAGVVLASKILKTPLKEKVAGVDFADHLLGVLAQTGLVVEVKGRGELLRRGLENTVIRCKIRQGIDLLSRIAPWGNTPYFVYPERIAHSCPSRKTLFLGHRETKGTAGSSGASGSPG